MKIFARAWRARRRSLSIAILAVLFLSIAVGGSVLELLYSGFVTSPGVPHAGDLYEAVPTVRSRDYAGPYGGTYEMYQAWAQVAIPGVRIGAFEASGAWARRGSYGSAVALVGVSPRLLALLGVAPALGRRFADEDERPASPPVAIVGHAVFAGALAGDASLLGRAELEIGGTRLRVIGAMPADFQVPFSHVRGPEVLVPIAAAASLKNEVLGPGTGVSIVARLAPGADPAQVGGRLAATIRPAPERQGWAWSAQLQSLRASREAGQGNHIALLLSGALAVILLSFLNAACMLGVEGLRRGQERSVKLALGASRARLRFEGACEGAMLGLLGGVGGAALAAAGAQWVARTGAAYLTIHFEPALSLVPLAGCVLLAAAAGCAAGALSAGTNSTTAARGRSMRLLAFCEMGLSVALVCIAASIAVSYIRLSQLPLGYTAQGVMAGSVHARLEGSTPELRRGEQVAEVQRLLSGLGSRPELAFPSISIGSPVLDARAPVSAGCDAAAPTAKPPAAYQVWFSTVGYFHALRIPVLRGTLDAFRLGSNNIAVDQLAATQLFGTDNVVGRRLSWGSKRTCGTIVAVVGNLRKVRPGAGAGGSFEATINPHVYTAAPPTRTGKLWTFEVFARTRDRGDRGRAALANAAQDALPSGIISGAFRLADATGESQGSQPFQLALAVAFAALALGIAMTGVFAFMGLLVNQRRGEMAVRMALGDTPSGLFARVVRQTALLGLGGAVLGLVLAYWAGAAIRTLLFEISPHDWRIMTVVLLAAVLASTAAGVLPALRAARTDPNQLLKDA
ncbi:MAG TPA: FtsX-like permease family protein [Terriglobales bacterium]|nr:FtsX-like permease family protein [Terriglobales bacterium]